MRALIPCLVLLVGCAESTLAPPVQGGVDAEPDRGLVVVGVAPQASLEAPVVSGNPDIELEPRETVVEAWEDVPGTPVALVVVVDVGYRAQAFEDPLRHAALTAIDAAGRYAHPQDRLGIVAHTDRVASRLTPSLDLATHGSYDALVNVATGLSACSSLRDAEGWSDLGYHSFAPQMPPCWSDERGTDLSAALALAAEALDEAPDDAIRGVIILGPGRLHALAAPDARPADLQLPWPSLVLHEAEASEGELRAAALDQAAGLADDDVSVWSIGVDPAADATLLRGLSSTGAAVFTRDPGRVEQTVRDAVDGLRAAAGR